MSRNNKNTPKVDIASKEEEYRKMNEELEAKTASLLEEAEAVMQDAEASWSSKALHRQQQQRPGYDELVMMDDFDNDLTALEASINRTKKPPSAVGDREPAPTNRPPSGGKRPQSSKLPASRRQAASRGKQRVASATASHVALPDDLAFVTELKTAIADIEHNSVVNESVTADDGATNDDDGVLPTVAADLGAEAQIRFLKAKIRVMQEELDRLGEEYNKAEESEAGLRRKLKEADEERARLNRTVQAQQTQLEKVKSLGDEARQRAETIDTERATLRRELDALRRQQKQASSTQSAAEVRLNRVTDELDKTKLQLQKAKAAARETSEGERRRLDELSGENKRLQRQKQELLAGFKKQLRLIDVLRRQRLNIEATRLLAFSEDEFMKALEWNN